MAQLTVHDSDSLVCSVVVIVVATEWLADPSIRPFSKMKPLVSDAFADSLHVVVVAFESVDVTPHVMVWVMAPDPLLSIQSQ